MTAFLRALVVKTLQSPPEAGEALCALNLDRESGWSALFLACILNTLVYFLTITIFPVPPEAMLPMMATPIMALVTLFSAVTIGVFVLFWTSKVLDGKARFGDILTMLAWMQFLSALVQLGAIVLMVLSSGIALMLAMAARLYGLWIMIHFLRVANGFDSMGKAAMTLVLALLGMTIGLSLFLSILGVTAMGIN